MADDLAALTLLGESADWLKDAEGMSIRDHRMTALDAYRAAWSGPTDNVRLSALNDAFGKLFAALKHNHLYPDALILGTAGNKSVRYLPALGTLRKDVDQLRDFCVINKFGIGEIHLLHMTLLLCRMLHQPQKMAYDQLVEDALADVVFLRVPIYRADNLGPFSSELRARFHAVRLMRAMRKLGLFDEAPVGEINAQDMAEARQLLTDPLRISAGRYIQRPQRLAFTVLDVATALEEHARAHAGGRVPSDERSPEELFTRLKHRVRQLPQRPDVGPSCRQRVLNLAVAASMRAVAHVDPPLGHDIYAFLRSGKYHPTVRHLRMFELLPNGAERLRFLNFLFLHGKQNPVYYIDKFGRFFPGEKLRFVSKEVGFAFEQQSQT